MGDRERKEKKINPAEDLEYLIDELRRKGETLKDETLERLIFSPGGSAVMEGQRREGRKGRGGLDEDFSDALEFIREDLQRTKGSNEAEEEEVYQDARSHFDSSSVVSSPHSHSPSMRGSINPLSPNTSNAVDKMSRVSLYSPATLPPGYFPPNGQGLPSPSHPSAHRTPLPPQLHHPVTHPPSIPPTLPNGSYHSNGSVPYPPPMVPSPYIPQSMPLPPSVPNGTAPSRNGHGMSTTSTVNPLFNPYAPPPTTMSYTIHPHASPYPPMAYPTNVPRIHPQKAAEKQRDQSELARFLAQQEQMTSRMMAQCSNQMHFPTHHIQHMQQQQHMQHPHSVRQQQKVQQTRHIVPPCTPSASVLPPTVPLISPSTRPSSSRHFDWYLPSTLSSDITPEMFVIAYDLVPKRAEIFKETYEQAKAIVEEKKRRRLAGEKEDVVVTIRFLPPPPPILPPGITPEMNEKAKKAQKKSKTKTMKDKVKREEEEDSDDEVTPREPRPRRKKKGKGRQTDDDDSTHSPLREPVNPMTEEELKEYQRQRRNEEMKKKLMSKFGTFVEDNEGNILPPELEGGRIITFEGDPRFPLPPGKDMSFYIRPADVPRSPRSPCPSPAARPLEYIEEVPACTEGRAKPLLSRGHSNTKERKEYPNLNGGKYLEKIQSLFHSVNGDPSRVPNASTKGDKWEYPFKEGEEPAGLEVYRNVRGRVWNADYDYSPVFYQLMEEIGEVNDSSGDKEDTEKTKKKINNLPKAEAVREKGYVFSCYPGSGMESESDLSDYGGDGRIAVGGIELKKIEDMKKGREKEAAEEERKRREEQEKEYKKKVLTRDPSKKAIGGYYPLLMADRHWGKITYYEKGFQVGDPYMCKWNIPKVHVDPQIHDKTDVRPERYALAAFDRIGRDEKTTKLLLQQEQTFYFKYERGGYLILGSDSEPPLFVQSPLYNAMMGEELGTIVRITKGHEMIIFDENFFNLLLQQAYQHSDRVVYEMRQLLHTRVSCTKGWGEAYLKSRILDTLVWIEIDLLNPMKKIDALLKGNTSIPKKTANSQTISDVRRTAQQIKRTQHKKPVKNE